MTTPRLFPLLLVLTSIACGEARPSQAQCAQEKLDVGMLAITACGGLRDAGIEMDPFEGAEPRVDKIIEHLEETNPACVVQKISPACSDALTQDSYRRVACDAAERAQAMLKASASKDATARVDEVRSVIADGRKKCF